MTAFLLTNGAFLLLALLGALCWRWIRRPVGLARRVVGRLAVRPALSIALVAASVFAAAAGLAALRGRPLPQVHDEFSYLLAADTFASGRLATSPHPMWQHFETFHVIQQPTYASKYPPAQGLFLALGQRLGHPIIGVWIGAAAFAAATLWMARAWLPGRWALVATLAVIVQMLFVGRPFADGGAGYWTSSYWGGAVAALGGALLFGALRRIVGRGRGPLRERSRARDGALLGAGLVILANSRPYEGLVASVPALVILLAWTWRGTTSRRAGVVPVLGSLLLVLVPGAGATSYYNWRVTGDALSFPAWVYAAQYEEAPKFLARAPNTPTYRHPAMQAAHQGWERVHRVGQRSFAGLAGATGLKLRMLLDFYGGAFVWLPLCGLLWAARDRWIRFAIVTCALLLAGLLYETWVLPHYAAPAASLVGVLTAAGARAVCLGGRRASRVRAALVAALCLAWLGTAVWAQTGEPRPAARDWYVRRAGIEAAARQGGARQLVIVHYERRHSVHEEWVANAADIDRAPVVWARSISPAADQRLRDYFTDRAVLGIDVD